MTPEQPKMYQGIILYAAKSRQAGSHKLPSTLLNKVYRNDEMGDFVLDSTAGYIVGDIRHDNGIVIDSRWLESPVDKSTLSTILPQYMHSTVDKIREEQLQNIETTLKKLKANEEKFLDFITDTVTSKIEKDVYDMLRNHWSQAFLPEIGYGRDIQVANETLMEPDGYKRVMEGEGIKIRYHLGAWQGRDDNLVAVSSLDGKLKKANFFETMKDSVTATGYFGRDYRFENWVRFFFAYSTLLSSGK